MVKVRKIHRTPSGEVDERVVFEARAMSQIDHPNVVRIFDFGIADGRLYSVTELCDSDMHMWSVTRGWREIVERILEAGRGIARLHAAGLIHGDIKPANILIKDGVAKIGDFGLAAKPGRAESVAGTPGYIAPEVAVGIRSASGDVFALAATAWACLFGTPPFGTPPLMADAGAAIAVLVQRAIDGEFVAEVRRHKGLPKLVRVVLRSGLHPDPDRRPPLDVWLAELAAVLDAADRGWAAGLRTRLPSVAFGGFTMVVTGLVVVGLMTSRPQPVDVTVDPAVQHVERVENAIKQGDVDMATSALVQASNHTDDLSKRELQRLADAATEIAVAFEKMDQAEDAIIAWMYAVRLYDCAEMMGDRTRAWNAMEAAIARENLKASGPF